MRGRNLITIEAKKFLVVGLARSGIACARFLRDRGGAVTATDFRPIDALDEGVKGLKNLGIEIETGGHNTKTFLDSDIIVVSPGVPMSIRPIRAARDDGIDVISEIELAYGFINAPIIAITGTNGKTTTTTLIGEIFKKSGKEIFVGGNIGNPLIEYVRSGREAEYVAAEISSFQLEGISAFRPKVALLLNISPDHLDRYPSYIDYVKAKKGIFLNQREGDIAILNADDRLVLEIGDSLEKVRKIYFSKKRKIEKGVYQRGQSIVSEVLDETHYYSTDLFKIKGSHNVENIMAAIAATEVCGCASEDIKETVNNFEGLAHRLEFVDEVCEVDFYNDSKATNIGAVEKSLESFDQPIILIAGGKDKGTGYDSLKDLVKEKVKTLVVFGEAGEAIYKNLGPLTQPFKAHILRDAVELAFSKASHGDVVLFSPACSSYDMFRDYEERGNAFKGFVRALKHGTDQTGKDVHEGRGRV